MGSAAGNQNSWTPYNYNDCSLGMCSIYCPQFCYFIFPPPPPLPDDDDSSPFSPLIIAVIGLLASAFILVCYYAVVTRYCTRSQDALEYSAGGGAAWQAAAVAAGGMEEAAIKAIAVCRYQKGEAANDDGAECAVCLSEFEEDERLRRLPKCGHAFHLPCIDTWLRSHSSCPLCRGGAAASPPRELVVVVDEEELHGGGGGGERESGVRGLRRSVSLGHVVVSIGEFGGDLGRKRSRSLRELNLS